MLNRRHIFAGAAALSIAATPVVAVANVSADAALLELGSRWEAAVERREAAITLVDRLEAHFDATQPHPPVIRATRECASRGMGPAGRAIPWADVQRVIRQVPEWERAAATGKPIYTDRSRWAERFRTADQRHKQRIADHRRQIGLEAADAEYDAAYALVCDLEEKIVAAPCATMAGLLVKAKVAKRVMPAIDDTENDWTHTVGLSVVDVLLGGLR